MAAAPNGSPTNVTDARLLFVDNRPGYFASHRLSLARAARERGYHVEVAALTAGDGTPIRQAGFPFHQVSSRRRSNNPFHELPIIFRLALLYHRVQPDLVHHVTLRAILYGGLASRVIRVPYVVQGITGLGYLYSADDPKTRVLRWITERGLRWAMDQPRQRVIFQNPTDLEYFVDSGFVTNDVVRLIRGSGVDPDRFPLRPVPAGEPVIVCPTRMLWHKGVGDFVEAARKLSADGERARFALVGDTDPDNPGAVAREQLADWESEGVVEWWGYRDDMPEVLRRCAIVCYPSRYREGVPKVLLEASSSGRPIVATDVPGCRQAVVDGETGFLVPPGDPDRLAVGLRRLLDQPDLRHTMSAKARQHCLESFTIEQVIQATLDVYCELIEADEDGSAHEIASDAP